MTTWVDYKQIMVLQDLLNNNGLLIRETQYGYVIRANSTIHPAFTKDNSLYLANTVDEAIAWIQGLTSDMWRKEMNKKDKL